VPGRADHRPVNDPTGQLVGRRELVVRYRTHRSKIWCRTKVATRGRNPHRRPPGGPDEEPARARARGRRLRAPRLTGIEPRSRGDLAVEVSVAEFARPALDPRRPRALVVNSNQRPSTSHPCWPGQTRRTPAGRGRCGAPCSTFIQRKHARRVDLRPPTGGGGGRVLASCNSYEELLNCIRSKLAIWRAILRAHSPENASIDRWWR